MGTSWGEGELAPCRAERADECELKKMYFFPELRGIGLGKRLLIQCLQGAIELGYRLCYLETLERMWQATRLYEKMGFQKLDNALGDTGHSSCELYYALDLREWDQRAS